MTIQYTNSLRLSLPGSGDLSGTWGTGANGINIAITQLLEDAIAGYVSVTHDDTANYTLTTVNGASDEARKMYVKMVGTLTAARNVVCPSQPKLYVIRNATTGGYALTLKTSGGTGISVPNGYSMVLYCDGTNVLDAITAFSSLYVSGASTFVGAATFSGGASDGTNSFGYLGVPQQSKSTDYTLVLSDSGKCVYHPSTDASARTFTIPANGSVAFPIGTIICFDNEFGAGTVTIACNDTLVLDVSGSTGSRTLAAGGFATARKVTSTKWRINGSSLT